MRDILRLETSEAQRSFVAPNSWSLSEALFAPEAWYRAIYAGDRPVGFVMVSDKPEEAEYFIWRFMIGKDEQRRGFGSRALELVIEDFARRREAREILTSCVPGEGSPQPFYEQHGFVPTGEVEDGEVVLKRSLA